MQGGPDGGGLLNPADPNIDDERTRPRELIEPDDEKRAIRQGDGLHLAKWRHFSRKIDVGPCECRNPWEIGGKPLKNIDLRARNSSKLSADPCDASSGKRYREGILSWRDGHVIDAVKRLTQWVEDDNRPGSSSCRPNAPDHEDGPIVEPNGPRVLAGKRQISDLHGAIVKEWIEKCRGRKGRVAHCRDATNEENSAIGEGDRPVVTARFAQVARCRAIETVGGKVEDFERVMGGPCRALASASDNHVRAGHGGRGTFAPEEQTCLI
jgi:hypothetical protein